MVTEATSRPDGLLTFPSWGPILGPPEGMVLNSDPVITLVKGGYRPRIINNPFPVEADETDRVRAFRQNGETFALEPFRGTPTELATELGRVAFGMAGPRTEEQTAVFQTPYLNRLRRVRGELNALAPDRRVTDLLWHVERGISSLE